MKKIKVIQKDLAFLTYMVEDNNVDAFISNIPNLGHGLPERTISYRDANTDEEIIEVLPQEYTVEIEDLNNNYEWKLQQCYAARRAAYPPIEDYLDAKVKQASSDPAVQIEGLTQEQEYLQACLLVKQSIPKPVQE